MTSSLVVMGLDTVNAGFRGRVQCQNSGSLEGSGGRGSAKEAARRGLACGLRSQNWLPVRRSALHEVLCAVTRAAEAVLSPAPQGDGYVGLPGPRRGSGTPSAQIWLPSGPLGSWSYIQVPGVRGSGGSRARPLPHSQRHPNSGGAKPDRVRPVSSRQALGCCGVWGKAFPGSRTYCLRCDSLPLNV